MDWTQTNKNEGEPDIISGPYPSRLCTKEEVGEQEWKKDKFWVCPPKNKLYAKGNDA